MNHIKTRGISLLLLCLLAGSIGWATAPGANATPQYITMNIHPGTAAGTVNLNCGWHGNCGDTPTSGDALDWASSGGSSIYLRTRTSYDGTSTIGGYGEAYSDTVSYCKTVAVEVRRPNDTDVLGIVYNLHSDNAYAWQFTISAGSSPILLASYVGKTTTDDNEDCNTSDPPNHLHQYATGSFAAHWSEYPSYVNATPNVPITNASKYQDYVSFEY